jgi:hypothetical protein
VTPRRHTLTALFLLIGLLSGVLYLILGALPLEGDAAGQTLEESGEAVTLTQVVDGAESAINDLLDRDHLFIQLYGGAQRLLGRRVVEDAVDPRYTVVKLTDGLLTFANLDAQRQDMALRAEEMAHFAQILEEERGIPFLYVQAPSKLDVADLPQGVEDYSGQEADQFLSCLAQQGVDTLDLRPAFRAAVEDSPEAAQALFFATDHHWTPAGAFLGYQTLSAALRARYGYVVDPRSVSANSFRRTLFQDLFLGSQGRRVGSLYAGLDGLELWVPLYPTSFTYTVPLSGIQREGAFESTLLFPERLAERDLFADNPYTIYSGGDYLISRAVNHENPDGPRILVLRDSFGCALTPFLSLMAGEVMAVDPRNFDGGQEEMLDYIDYLEPDLVLVLNTTSSLRVDALFPYLPGALSEGE